MIQLTSITAVENIFHADKVYPSKNISRQGNRFGDSEDVIAVDVQVRLRHFSAPEISRWHIPVSAKEGNIIGSVLDFYA